MAHKIFKYDVNLFYSHSSIKVFLKMVIKDSTNECPKNKLSLYAGKTSFIYSFMN